MILTCLDCGVTSVLEVERHGYTAKVLFVLVTPTHPLCFVCHNRREMIESKSEEYA